MRPVVARSIAAFMLVVGGTASVTLLFTRSGEASTGIAFTAFLVVGALLIAKRPEQPIGWLFSTGSFVYLVGDVAASIVDRPGFPGWPGPWWAGASLWVRSWYFWVVLALLVPLPALLFPTGRVLSRRWRAAVVTTIVGVALQVGAGALSGVVCVEGTGDDCLLEMAKPLGITGWRGDESMVSGLGMLLLFGSVVASLISVVLRFRRSRGVERAQMKWFALGLGAAVAVVLLAAATDGLDLPIDLQVVYSLGLAALPVSVAIAITRYRLYDIDRIVGRTISYAVVLGVLTLVFIGLVGAPVVVLGSGEAPAWLVAASTLIVFTLFNPLRRRVQRVVDRRFNRLPYDPEAVHRALAESLRDEVTAPAIAAAWEEYARTALQPASTGVWMRGPG